jgi:phosphoglycerate kinase
MINNLKDIDFKGKRVLIRVDYNVPLDEKNNIADDMRIRESLPTLKYLLKMEAKQIVIMTHMGRPDGMVVNKWKLDKVAARLMSLLGKEVVKLDNCVGVKIPPKKIVMLENLRFHKEEEEGDVDFAKTLSSYGDVYVEDAFANCHRDHASMTGVPKFLLGCVGMLVEKELKDLSLENTEKPLVAIIGGAKLRTKIPIIQNMLKKVDRLLAAGAMIFTFYKAMGYEIGRSKYESDQTTMAEMIMHNDKLVLPKDIVVADSIGDNAMTKTVSAGNMLPNWYGLDIGPESIGDFKKILSGAKTVIWNGPLGYFELKPFAKATEEIAQFLAGLKAKTIIGGGDTAELINRLGLKSKFYHVSTGGAASMILLEGEKLVALEVLDK